MTAKLTRKIEMAHDNDVHSERVRTNAKNLDYEDQDAVDIQRVDELVEIIRFTQASLSKVWSRCEVVATSTYASQSIRDAYRTLADAMKGLDELAFNTSMTSHRLSEDARDRKREIRAKEREIIKLKQAARLGV